MTTRSWNDLRIEIIIGGLLRTGVIMAAAIVLFGAVVFLAQHGQEVATHGVFRGEPESLTTVSGIIHGVLHLSGRAIIQLGLLILIATPVARVAFSAVAFAIEHDYLYVWITLFVLAVLLYSLLGSH
jgi:uncharacterized membrane protein